MLVREEMQLKEGYLMRPVTRADLEKVVELINVVSRSTMGGSNEATLGDIGNFWETPGLSLEDDLRIMFAPQGETVGYIEAMTFEKPPAYPYLWLRVHPDFINAGVGEALLDWALDRVNYVLDVVPGDLRVAIGIHNISTYKAMDGLYTSRGFVLNRHSFHMHVDIKDKPAEPQWPEGITLQPFDPQRDGPDVYRANDEAFSDHFGHQPRTFEEGYALFKHLMLDDKEAFDKDLWFIAMDGDQVAGMSLCRVNTQEAEPMGWVNSLGVRRRWRKRGLGMALLLHSFNEFYKRGLEKGGLGVDASNLTGALRLYERAGMYVAHQHDRYEKELRPGKELMTTGLTE